MDYTQSFAISALGMGIARAGVDVAALNLANANTVQGTVAGSYRPLRVVADARAVAGSLGGELRDAFGAMVSRGMGDAPWPSVRIVPADTPPRLVYEPGHPSANERGFVAYPGVDMATEMVSLMRATRAYEANVAAMNTTRMLALRALDIGGRA